MNKYQRSSIITAMILAISSSLAASELPWKVSSENHEAIFPNAKAELPNFIDAVIQYSDSNADDYVWCMALENSCRILMTDNTDNSAFIRALSSLVVQKKSTHLKVYNEQMSCVYRAINRALDEEFKPKAVPPRKSGRTSSHLIVLAAIFYNEINAKFEKNYIMRPTFSNVSPNLELAVKKGVAIRAGMDPEGIKDEEVKNDYVNRLKENENNSYSNIIQTQIASCRDVIRHKAIKIISDNGLDENGKLFFPQ